PALRALREVPLLVTCQRAHAARVWADVRDEGELDREIALRRGHRPAAIAIDDRDRRAPVALARDAPVVQAVLHLGGGEAPRLQPRDDAPAPLAARQAVELPGIHEPAVFGDDRERPPPRPLGPDPVPDRALAGRGEREAALRVWRHGRRRPRTGSR